MSPHLRSLLYTLLWSCRFSTRLLSETPGITYIQCKGQHGVEVDGEEVDGEEVDVRRLDGEEVNGEEVDGEEGGW